MSYSHFPWSAFHFYHEIGDKLVHKKRGCQRVLYNEGKTSRFARLCENYVNGSTELTTNGVASFKFEHLAVRPELRRRAPMEFSHSLLLSMTHRWGRAELRYGLPG